MKSQSSRVVRAFTKLKRTAARKRMSPVAMQRLEMRTFFDAVTPTALEQYALALINRARVNPTAEIQRLAGNPGWAGTPDLNEGLSAGTISADPKQPLAFNLNLIDAARKHSTWIITQNGGVLSHTEGTLGPADRAAAAGFQVTQVPVFEGIASTAAATTDTATLQNSIDSAYDSLITDKGEKDRGHRVNLFQPSTNVVGVGESNQTGQTDLNQVVLTEDPSGTPGTTYLEGYAINDLNHDQFYQPGEGLGGVTITATRTSDNQVFSTTTWDSGGYTLPLAAGTYIVTATGGNVGTPPPQTVTISNLNVESDFISSQTATLAAPTIVTQPVIAGTNVGNTAIVSVAAGGNPTPTVQWQSAPAGSTTFTPIAGATSFQLSIPNVTQAMDSTQYQAVLTNSQGTLTSNTAFLSVTGVALNVTQQPVTQTVNAGDTVTFTANVAGATAYNWRVQTPGGNFSDAGSKTNTLTFTADPSQSGNQYFLVASNAGGINQTTTSMATLTVNGQTTAPTITAQPQTTTVTTFDANGNVIATATGFPDPTVQWQVAAANTANTATAQFVRISDALAKHSKFKDIDGQTQFTLSVPVTMANSGEKLRAIITNEFGSVTTDTVTLSGNHDPVAFNDRASLATAIQAAQAAIEGCRERTASLVAALTADLSRLHATSTATTRLQKLAKHETAVRQTFAANETAVFNQFEHLSKDAYDASKSLKSDPADSAMSHYLRSAIKQLGIAAGEVTAPADATQCNLAITSQLDPIASVAPTDVTLQRDVQSGYSTADAIGQALQAPVNIVLATVQRFKNDSTS